MKKIALAGLIVVTATLTLVPPSEAGSRRHHQRSGFHSSVVFGFGPAVYWGPYPYWYYPPPYVVYTPPPYAVYAPPPVVVQEAPPVYVQRPPPPAPPVEQYWYYCSSASGYYPAVPNCPEAWIKVAPRPQ